MASKAAAKRLLNINEYDWPKEPKGNYKKNPEGGNANENMRGVWKEQEKIKQREKDNEQRAKDRENEQKIKDAAKKKLKKEIITKRYFA
jgi:hypothetical protein